MSSPWTRLSCCNPFDLAKHGNVRVGIRPLSALLQKKLPNALPGSKICTSCRRRLSSVDVVGDELVSSPSEDDSSVASTSSDNGKIAWYQKEVSMSSFNDCLISLGESPISKKKLEQAKYNKNKWNSVKKALKRSLFATPGNSNESEDSDNNHNTSKPSPMPTTPTADSEMLKQLKEKFNSTDERSTKIQLLTVLPKSWSLSKIEQEFGAPNYMARKAKRLVKERGIMSTPIPKRVQGHALSKQVVEEVHKFYQEDDISRLMPGKKDFLSVKQSDGKRVHTQKRLILHHLKDIYALFKEKFPNYKIGFSKFAELRPKECVLPGSSDRNTQFFKAQVERSPAGLQASAI